MTKAQTLYKQALDLVPDHLDSLLGYGKILVRSTQFQKARRIFHDAVEVDPNNVVAKQYLSSIEKTLSSQLTKNNELQQQQRETSINQSLLLKKGRNLTARESSAYQDALMERNLTLLDDNPFDGENEEEGEVDSDEDDGRGRSRKRDIDRNRKQKRRKRYKRRKEKKNKKRKRRRCDTSSSSSSSSIISSDDTSISSSKSSKSPQKSDPNNGEDNDTKITKSDIKSHSPIAEESSEHRAKVDTTKETPTAGIENKNDPDSGEGDDSYKEHRRHRRRRKDNKDRDRRERKRTKKRSKHSAKKKSRRRKEKDIVDDDSQASSSIEEE
jgi:tetratricopeptide (TPR) repeat protein